MPIDPLTVVTGHEKLTGLYNRWPSFHDSEVLSIHLDREGPEAPVALIRVHLFEGSPDAANPGRIAWKNHSVATLKFKSVVGLELSDFNRQNAIFDLGIELAPAGHDDVTWAGPAYEVVISSSYGVGGSFICSSIEVVSVEKKIPPGSVYS